MDIDNMEAGSSSAIQQNVGRKRTVDADDPSKELTDPKKPRIDLNNPLKLKVYNFIIEAFTRIEKLSKIRDASSNISVGCQIHNILFTCYTILRQKANKTGGNLEQRIGQTEFIITDRGGKTAIKKDDAINAVEEAATRCEIPFKKIDMNDKDNWYGIAGPVMNFLAGFDLRLSELRLGHHEMRIRKDRGEITAFKVSQYGMFGCHHVLLEGVSFPPEKRTAMAQSLGPLTILLNYIKSDARFGNKWEVAAKRAFAHFPDIDAILAVIKGKKAEEIRSLIHAMGDLALITTTRQATRMFPPPCAFVKILREKPNIKEGFTFSGKGAFAFYREFCEIPWILNGAMTDIVASQIVYHSMFGTYKEDLSILSQITNLKTWDTRESMGNCMTKMNTCGQSALFDPVKHLVYAKLSSANQTGLLSSNYTQLSTIPVFSGKRIQKFRGDFFEYLREKHQQAVGGKSIYALTQSIRTTVEELATLMEKNNGQIHMGTTEWMSNGAITGVQIDQPVMGHVVHGEGICFLGRN